MPLEPVSPPLVPLLIAAAVVVWRVSWELRLALYDQYPKCAALTLLLLFFQNSPPSLIHIPTEPRKVGILPLGEILNQQRTEASG